MANTLTARAEKAEFLELITLLEPAITISGYVDRAKEQFFYEKSFQKSMNGQDKGKWIQTEREEDEGEAQVPQSSHGCSIPVYSRPGWMGV